MSPYCLDRSSLVASSKVKDGKIYSKSEKYFDDPVETKESKALVLLSQQLIKRALLF